MQSWHAEFDAKEKLLEPVVQRAVDRVRATTSAREPKLAYSFFYGAIGFGPENLVVWFIFATDAAKAEAEKNGLLEELDRRSRDALREEGYPASAVERVLLGFASEEEIERGGGYVFFK